MTTPAPITLPYAIALADGTTLAALGTTLFAITHTPYQGIRIEPFVVTSIDWSRDTDKLQIRFLGNIEGRGNYMSPTSCFSTLNAALASLQEKVEVVQT